MFTHSASHLVDLLKKLSNTDTWKVAIETQKKETILSGDIKERVSKEAIIRLGLKSYLEHHWVKKNSNKQEKGIPG